MLLMHAHAHECGMCLPHLEGWGLQQELDWVLETAQVVVRERASCQSHSLAAAVKDC
jgi:hypothetical protein